MPQSALVNSHGQKENMARATATGLNFPDESESSISLMSSESSISQHFKSSLKRGAIDHDDEETELKQVCLSENNFVGNPVTNAFKEKLKKYFPSGEQKM